MAESLDYRTCVMDTAKQAKYEHAMMEIGNIKLRFERRPIKFHCGDDFDTWLTNLRSLLEDEKLEGRQKVRVQIIFQTADDVQSNIEVLNSLTEEINDGLSGIEFIVATKGSLVLIVDILLEMLETDNKLLTTLALFLEKILARITTVTSETINIVVLPVKESKQWKTPKSIGGQVCLEFDIEAQLLETDDKMEAQSIKISDANLKHSNGSGTNQEITATLLPIDLESKQWKTQKSIEGQVCLEFDIEAQLLETDDKMEAQSIKISDAIPQHSNGSGTNQKITATLLPIDLEIKEACANSPISEENTTTEESFTQAQTPVKYNLPVSVSLRQMFHIRKSKYEHVFISSCLKTGNTLMFADHRKDRLIICNSDGTDIHDIPLPYTPYYMTEIDSNTVAVSCSDDKIILIIHVSTRSVTSTIRTSNVCRGISYNDNNLYVVIGKSKIHVMDLTGKILRTMQVPSRPVIDFTGIHDITIDRDRLVCIDTGAIYCYSLDGKLIWISEKFNTRYYRRVTTDNKGNVYGTNIGVNTVVVTGQHQTKLLTLSIGIIWPYGIFFDKKENILLVCSHEYGFVFLFDVKDK